MAPRKSWILIILGVIILLAGSYFIKGKFFKNKEIPAAQSAKKLNQSPSQIQKIMGSEQRALNSISQTQNALRTVDEINRLNQFNQQLQKEMQRQERQLGK